jgi:hypothetical protein
MSALVSLLVAGLLLVPQDGAERPTITVRSAGEARDDADLVGDDDRVLLEALDRLRQGGTLVLGAGRYTIRRALRLPPDLVLRGEDGATLVLPAPVLTAAAAAAGATRVELSDASGFRGESRVQILPPVGRETFADGLTRSLELQQIGQVEGDALVLLDPLVLDVPEGSRVGYPHKLMWVDQGGRTTIENLVFEGGLRPEIPMPGHSQRCAIWSAAPFGFGQERLAPPGHGLVVRHCLFRDWYGRPIAVYNQEDGLIEGNVFESVLDEAIDLDHFVERFRVVGNQVRGALWGIVMNDASRNVVEYNQLEDCDVGIIVWRYERTPPQGINEENVVRHNVIRGSRIAIQVDADCHRNEVRANHYEGQLLIVEPTNLVVDNRRL